MLKREIKFENYDNEEEVQTFYFNLTKAELIQMEFDTEGGFGKILQRMVDEKDNKNLLKMFKDFILQSYGEKSPDGRRFIKNDELREAFSQTAAFEALFTEFMVDAEAGAKFLEGIMPKDLEEFSKKIQDQDKPTGPPPTASQLN